MWSILGRRSSCSWRGQSVIGVMYCVLVGHTIVSLQTRDTGTEFTPSMYVAIGAIEGIRAR
jgi:hypothetical protein